MTTFARIAAVVNKAVVPALDLPVVGSVLRRGIIVISYTGRKSGREFELPVSYVQRADTVTVGVALPDRKSWWRNFSGEGGPIVVHLPGGPRSGHAVSRRDDSGAVSVTVALDPVES